MTPRTPDPLPEGGGPAGQPTADAMMARTIRIIGPAGVLDVWLGTAGDLEALERDVREVSAQATDRISTLAVAMGEVARRHRLEVRVIPRTDQPDPSILVVFGARTYRPK